MNTIREKSIEWAVTPLDASQPASDQHAGYQRGTGQTSGQVTRQVLGVRSVPADDPRSDSKLRTVFFEPERIVILRSVAGVSMRIAVSIDCFDAVRLKVKFTPAAPVYNVILRHDDPDLCVTLFEGDDMEFAQAALAEWGNYFGLEKIEDVPVSSGVRDSTDLCCDADEETSATNASILKQPIARRRGSALSKRRPRLYSRRHMGDLAMMDNVYRGNREIIARN